MSNQSFGVPTSRLTNMRNFDQLPAPVRHVIAHAPFDYNVSGLLDSWRAARKGGASVAEFRRETIAMLCEHLMAECLRTYGPDHPDARRSRLTRRAA